MSVDQWVLQLLLGGILGTIGQGIRIITGLKKVNDQAALEKEAFSDLFEPQRMMISVLIGFLAGSVAIIAASSEGDTTAKVDRQTILTLLAAGYAGTDFIEGFIHKYIPAREARSIAAATKSGTTVVSASNNLDQPAMG